MLDDPRKAEPAPAGDTRRVCTDHSADLQRVLLDVARSTATCRDIPRLLTEAASVLRPVVRFDALRLLLHDADREVMRLHSYSAQREPARPVVELPVDELPAGMVWRTQQPMIVDLLTETRFPLAVGILREDGMRSLCVLPLTSPYRRLGALGFVSVDEQAFGDADLDFLGEIASQVALAVDNTLHHEAAEKTQRQLAAQRDRLQLLLDVNNTLVSNRDPRELFGAIAAVLRPVVAHEYAGIAVFDPKRDGFEMWALEFAGSRFHHERMFIPREGSASGIAFAASQPTTFRRDQLAALPSEIVRMLLADGVETLCCLPLTVHDRRLGLLNVGRRGDHPFSADEIALLADVAGQVVFLLENALAFEEIAALKDKLAAEKLYLESELRTEHNFEEIIGQSEVLKRVLYQVETVAPTDSTVLIRGETGTGKELIARAIHDIGERRRRSFVKVNCAAIPTGLLESELFGHERGAFTGALTQRIGRFELAAGGTIFLDEVGDIPLDVQPKLLRVLQEQEFERLGGTRTIHVDVRIIAATNRDLEEMTSTGTFRSDLYYRLNVFPVTVPPLRERAEDIPQLVRHYVQKFARRMKKPLETIPADTMTVLSQYDWPGNVRELENVIERAVILSEGPILRVPVTELRGRDVPPAPSGTLEATERDTIVRTLRETNWVLGGPRGAAARLGLKRTTLQSRMRKLGIRADRSGR